MFNPLRRKPANATSPADSKKPQQHFKWFGQAAFNSLGKLIDNSLSTVSEQLIEHIQNASYDIDLNNARRETFINERYLNQHRSLNQSSPTSKRGNLSPSSSSSSSGPVISVSNVDNSVDDIEDSTLRKAEDIQRIKQALSEYREYKKSQNLKNPQASNVSKPVTPRKKRQYPYSDQPYSDQTYKDKPQDSMN